MIRSILQERREGREDANADGAGHHSVRGDTRRVKQKAEKASPCSATATIRQA